MKLSQIAQWDIEKRPPDITTGLAQVPAKSRRRRGGDPRKQQSAAVDREGATVPRAPNSSMVHSPEIIVTSSDASASHIVPGKVKEKKEACVRRAAELLKKQRRMARVPLSRPFRPRSSI